MQAEEINLEQLISLIDNPGVNRQDYGVGSPTSQVRAGVRQFTEGLADYPDKTDPRLLAAKKGYWQLLKKLKDLIWKMENPGSLFEKTRKH